MRQREKILDSLTVGAHFYSGYKGLKKGRAQHNPRIDHPDYYCGRVRKFGTIVQFWNCLRVSPTLYIHDNS